MRPRVIFSFVRFGFTGNISIVITSLIETMEPC